MLVGALAMTCQSSPDSRNFCKMACCVDESTCCCELTPANHEDAPSTPIIPSPEQQRVSQYFADLRELPIAPFNESSGLEYPSLPRFCIPASSAPDRLARLCLWLT